MKKRIAVLLSVLFLFCLALPCFAVEETPDDEVEVILDEGDGDYDAEYEDAFEEEDVSEAPLGSPEEHGVIADFEGVLTDSAELLTPEEKAELKAKLEAVGAKYDVDVCVVTVTSLNGKDVEEYADDYFDYNGYGRNSSNDGILLLLSMEDRDWAISTCGNCIDAFTDNGQAYMVDKMIKDLKADRFASAISKYAETCDELLEMWANGNPYDKSQSKLRKIMVGSAFPVGILLAAAAGFLFSSAPMSGLKSEIDNVKWQKSAADYTRQGSMQLYQSQDSFLYTNTSRVKVESSSTRSGSSTHTSSSGRTHGGSHGKF